MSAPDELIEPIELEGGARLRRATFGDLAALVAIKRALPMPTHAAGVEGEDIAETRSGGFLLGSEEQAYRELLAVARLWLLELEGAPVGFTVTLDDPTLRASPVWARRQTIRWREDFDPEDALARRVAYFDQLAVLPRGRSRYWGAALALRALAELIEDEGHELVLTTTVIEPIVNRAALPHLGRVGAREVGRLDESYPGVGRVVSAIHAIEARRYREHIGKLHCEGPPAVRRVITACLERP